LRSTFYKPELSGMIDPYIIEGKAKLFIDFEDRLTIFDTLILCRFYRDLYPWKQLIEIINFATGLKIDQKTLQEKAATISTLVRRFNLREGLKPEDDRLPKRSPQGTTRYQPSLYRRRARFHAKGLLQSPRLG